MRPKRTRALNTARPKRLFEVETDARHDARQLIKSCVRSGYAWIPIQRDILKIMLEHVNKFGRLPTPQHRLLMGARPQVWGGAVIAQ
jgi:hypothetical protein